MQPLKKPTQLKRWGKKNKISNKKFSRLTGLSLKKMSKSKKLPKIVIPVHLSGTSCDMDSISKLSKIYNFKS